MKRNTLEYKSKKIIPLTLALAVLVLTTSQISSIEFIKPVMAAELSNVGILPSTNVVNERTNYDFIFTTATTGTIQFIAIILPNTGVADTPRLIERSGIGPGFLTTITGAQGPIHVYVVNNPVSIPAGTEIRLELGTITNPNTAGNFPVIVATLGTNAAIIDSTGSFTPSFVIKDITGNDVSPNFMLRKSLLDDSAGNTKGWNPNGAGGVGTITFAITDSDVTALGDSAHSVFVSILLRDGGQSICQVLHTGNGFFTLQCNTPPPEGAQLHYVISKLPAHLVQSSSLSTSSSPFDLLQD